jgi:hypothetical protein
MMRVTYIGPIAVVFLPMSGHLAARFGDPIEVDDAYGISLCEQLENWRPADPESQAVLDEFYRWVVAHELRETVVDGEIVVRWMPRIPDDELPVLGTDSAGARLVHAHLTGDTPQDLPALDPAAVAEVAAVVDAPVRPGRAGRSTTTPSKES